VLPGTLIRVLLKPLVPVQPPPVPIKELAPDYEEQVLSSKESLLEIAPALMASPDINPSLVFNWASHTWSLPMSTVWPPLDYEELGPYDKEPLPTSCGTLPDYLLVLLEVPVCSPLTLVGSPDKGDHSIPSPLFSRYFLESCFQQRT